MDIRKVVLEGEGGKPLDKAVVEVAVVNDKCGDDNHDEHPYCYDDAEKMIADGWVRVEGPNFDDPRLGRGWKSVLVRVELDDRWLATFSVLSGRPIDEYYDGEGGVDLY